MFLEQVKQELIEALQYLEEEGKSKWELAKKTAEKYGEKSQKVLDNNLLVDL